MLGGAKPPRPSDTPPMLGGRRNHPVLRTPSYVRRGETTPSFGHPPMLGGAKPPRPSDTPPMLGGAEAALPLGASEATGQALSSNITFKVFPLTIVMLYGQPFSIFSFDIEPIGDFFEEKKNFYISINFGFHLDFCNDVFLALPSKLHLMQ